jgi:Cys-tRNA(Pro)/Cys-tRNA(Cys) deacylase
MGRNAVWSEGGGASDRHHPRSSSGPELSRPQSKSTRAAVVLDKVGINFTLHSYDYDPDAERVGLQAAEALGIEPRRLLKTLMVEVDGKPACVVVPSDREVSLKKLALAFQGKTAKMMRPADAERLTGYRIGGISSFAQKKRVRVAPLVSPTPREAQALVRKRTSRNFWILALRSASEDMEGPRERARHHRGLALALSVSQGLRLGTFDSA